MRIKQFFANLYEEHIVSIFWVKSKPRKKPAISSLPPCEPLPTYIQTFQILRGGEII
jgi:hypothetical protein